MRIVTAGFVLVAASVVGGALAQEAAGEWGLRAELIEPNSEFAVAEWDGRIYVIGGYPSTRTTVTTVQIYDARSDTWELGPPLPVPNNHGMAAAVDGIIYAIGGQTAAGGRGSFVNTVYALDPDSRTWEERTPMPTARSSGVAIVLDGKIYVAGGRPPRGNDFAVYDPKSDSWAVLPDLPSQRNHIAGAAINGRVYVAGGRLGSGFRSGATAMLEAFDPVKNSWSEAAPMLRPRSGVNGVAAHGCFHVGGGEGASGMFADHDVYNPRSDTWTPLDNMPIPVHGVTGAVFFQGLIHLPGGGLQTGGRSGSHLNQVYVPAMRCE